MMINTKHTKIEFGQIVHSQYKKEISQNTQGVRQERIEIIKMTQKKQGESGFSGSRKVNYADQKMKETYRKINKMLGGN